MADGAPERAAGDAALSRLQQIAQVFDLMTNSRPDHMSARADLATIQAEREGLREHAKRAGHAYDCRKLHRGPGERWGCTCRWEALIADPAPAPDGR